MPNQTKALTEDKSKIKSYGYPIKNWGNQENKLGRMSYSQIREYMFAALVARTDIDFIALDKGEITPQRVVDQLINKMEQYANFGFDYIHERMEEQPDCFFKEGAFLQLFLEFLNKEEQGSIDSNDDDSPEEIYKITLVCRNSGLGVMLCGGCHRKAYVSKYFTNGRLRIDFFQPSCRLVEKTRFLGCFCK